MQIQDAAGKPLPGFGLDDCRPICGDQIERGIIIRRAHDGDSIFKGEVIRAKGGLMQRRHTLHFAFTRDGMGIALHALTEEQVEVLVSECNLVVEHTVFTEKVRS